MTPPLIDRLKTMMAADGNKYECVLSVREVTEIINELERLRRVAAMYGAS